MPVTVRLSDSDSDRSHHDDDEAGRGSGPSIRLAGPGPGSAGPSQLGVTVSSQIQVAFFFRAVMMQSDLQVAPRLPPPKQLLIRNASLSKNSRAEREQASISASLKEFRLHKVFTGI